MKSRSFILLFFLSLTNRVMFLITEKKNGGCDLGVGGDFLWGTRVLMVWRNSRISIEFRVDLDNWIDGVSNCQGRLYISTDDIMRRWLILSSLNFKVNFCQPFPFRFNIMSLINRISGDFPFDTLQDRIIVGWSVQTGIKQASYPKIIFPDGSSKVRHMS